MDGSQGFDLEIRRLAGGPVRAVSASGFRLADLPALRLPPVDRDWLIVLYLESPDLFERGLADLCRVAGIGGGPVADTPYFAVEPGGALRLFATRAFERAYHAALLFAPQRPTAADLAALGVQPAEHWSPKRLGDGLYVECWDRAVTLFAESDAVVARLVNGALRIATGVETDHVRGLAIDLGGHAAAYTIAQGPEGTRLTRVAAGAHAHHLPDQFLTTREGWALEPAPQPPAAEKPPPGRRGGLARRLRRFLEALVGYPVVVLVRAALLPPSAARRVRRLFR